MIAKITRCYKRHYSDNRTTVLYVEWQDTKGNSGRTEGKPSSLHLAELVKRGQREGVKLETETW